MHARNNIPSTACHFQRFLYTCISQARFALPFWWRIALLRVSWHVFVLNDSVFQGSYNNHCNNTLDTSGVKLKDVHAHCYCASLVCTLYMTWHAPRHVFQARTPSWNSTKYRADDLCGNLICEYFCWMLSDPPFFRQITSFSDSFHYTKRQKKSVRGKF